MSIEAIALSGEPITIPDNVFEEFRAVMRGPVLAEGDAGYEEARVIWSKNYARRRPAIIAQCSGVADVVDAVNFAREHSLLTSVRGGGHSIQGFGNAEGGLKIDLSAMHTVTLDPERNTARVQGGSTIGDVDRETTRAGLAVPTGVAPTTGMGGLTLGGGVGWLHRKYGLTLDNLVSMEIVTADGEVRRVSESSEPDLFWALRGGGGNFGVVTEFEFRTVPIEPLVAFAFVAYPLSDFREISRQWRDWTLTVPDEVTSRLVSLHPTEHPNFPPELLDRDLAIVSAMYSGNADEGRDILEPIRHFGTPIADMSRDASFRDIQGMFDSPYGVCSGYWKSMYVAEMADEVLDIVGRWTEKHPVDLAITQLLHMGGAVGRVGPADTAFGDRSANYIVSAEGAYFNDEDEEACTVWAREYIAEIAELPYSRGTYLNFNGQLDEESRGEQFGENMKRLREIKRRYDPNNLFKLNNNIPPA